MSEAREIAARHAHAAVAVRADLSSRPRTRRHRFLTAWRAHRAAGLFGGDYEDGRRVHSSEPSSACGGPPRSPVGALRRPEHVPSPSEICREIEFLTVNAGFGPS